jgi:hypothetical protein
MKNVVTMLFGLLVALPRCTQAGDGYLITSARGYQERIDQVNGNETSQVPT